jgi:hypothetical protein
MDVLTKYQLLRSDLDVKVPDPDLAKNSDPVGSRSGLPPTLGYILPYLTTNVDKNYSESADLVYGGTLGPAHSHHFLGNADAAAAHTHPAPASSSHQYSFHQYLPSAMMLFKIFFHIS